jgi:hypothetical protein
MDIGTWGIVYHMNPEPQSRVTTSVVRFADYRRLLERPLHPKDLLVAVPTNYEDTNLHSPYPSSML